MTPLRIVGFLLLVISVTSIAHVIDDIATSYKPYDEAWTPFKTKFERSYTEKEESQRKHAFVERVKEIEAHNQRYMNNQETYTMGINQFTDSLDSDSGSCHVDEDEAWDETGRHKRQTGFCSMFSPPTNDNPPDSLDWREKGAVTAVGDQGVCGSCYAFGVTTTISAQLQRKTGKLIALSEQQVVDCTRGCTGSNAETSFRYINNAGGIVSSATYPYTNQARRDAGSCEFGKYKTRTVANVTGCQFSNSETSLKSMVAHLGPVYVSMAVLKSFQSYRVSDNEDVLVYTSPSCSSESPDYSGRHCLTVVGYGSHKGTDYWIVKNSWGTKWGKKGYGFIQRGTNLCGIGDRITVPEVQIVDTYDGSSGAVPTKNIAFWSPSFLIFLAFCFVAA